MSGMKSLHYCHVAWSRNHRDKFVAISTDIKLYEFTSQQQQAQGPQAPQSNVNNLNINHGSNATLGRSDKFKQQDRLVSSRLIATGPEVSLFKAAACYPGSISDDDTLVAVSCGGVQNTGKIVLVCLRPAGMYSIDNYIHVDLVAKRALCNDVDWSPVNNSLLATAWDRHKIDNSLQIFDINRIIDTGKYSFTFSMTPNNRPVFDGCPGDSINSLKWLKKEQTVVCGLNSKQIRIFDIRDLTKPKLIAPTKAVHGLTVDAFSDRRFASYVDNTIFIWDSRFFDKPLVSITESKAVSQIRWCPTRNHAFSALMYGDDYVKIYDIQQASLFSEDFEAKIVERLIHPFASSSSSSSTSPTATSSFDQPISGTFNRAQNSFMPKQIASYDWHPTSELRLIAISNSRDVIGLDICDRITLNWSPICEIVWTKGKKILQCLDPRDEKYKSLDDISVNMRHRAITSYGMVVEEGPHHQRGDDSDLIGLLRWVKLAKALDITSKKIQHSSQNPTESNRNCAEILGVGSLLRDTSDQTPSRAEVKAIYWKGVATLSCVMAPIRFQVYHSELRSRALLLCDWIPDIDNISQTIPIIDYLEKEGNYMRAAAIAVFNMRLQRAIESLTVGAKKSDPNLSSVAMALSGYTGERTSMWREMCQSLKGQLTNPYMKAMFAFLTSDSDTAFHEIIDDKNLILADRVAFSLLYLPDNKLNLYLSETMSTLVDNGDLNGILLTGITHDGLSLLQRYIEISSDIQSVSLIVLHSLPSIICSDPRAQLWVDCYRGMLDCWRLWHQRAQFDNLWYSNSSNLAKPPNHILISCNYCGNTINKSQQQQQQLNQTPSMSSNIQTKTSYASPSTPSAASSHNQLTQTVAPTDYYKSQQMASSVPVTVAGVSSSSFNSNSSTNSTLSSATTAVSAGTTLGPTSSSSFSTTGGDTASLAPAPSDKSKSCSITSQSTPTATLPTSGTTLPASGSVRSKSCTNCKKCSFAKCCLCLTQLGSNQILFDHTNIRLLNSKNQRTGGGAGSGKSSTLTASKTNPFSNWFSWCQTCRHGAHSAHLLSWFSENSECPVSGCNCKCMNLDSRTKLDDVQRVQ